MSAPAIRHEKWDDIPRETVTDDIARRLFTGERMMLAQVYLDRGAIVPWHSHENEQLTWILSGALRFLVGEEGSDDVVDIVVSAGEVLYIPSNVPHRGGGLRRYGRRRYLQSPPPGLAAGDRHVLSGSLEDPGSWPKSPCRNRAGYWHDGEFVPWAEAKQHLLDRRAVRDLGVRGHARVRHAQGSGDLPARRAYPPPLRLRAHLPHGPGLYPREPGGREPRGRREERAQGLLHPPDDPEGLRGAGAEPAHSPIETFVAAYSWGAYLGDGALQGGVDVCVSSWQRPSPTRSRRAPRPAAST